MAGVMKLLQAALNTGGDVGAVRRYALSGKSGANWTGPMFDAKLAELRGQVGATAGKTVGRRAIPWVGQRPAGVPREVPITSLMIQPKPAPKRDYAVREPSVLPEPIVLKVVSDDGDAGTLRLLVSVRSTTKRCGTVRYYTGTLQFRGRKVLPIKLGDAQATRLDEGKAVKVFGPDGFLARVAVAK